MSVSLPSMTVRQQAAWPEKVAEVNRCGDADLPIQPHSWDIAYQPEQRPGRGRDLSATYCDGEYFAQIMLDVYGNGSASIASLTWLHASSDEECSCDHCVTERTETEEER